MGLVLSKLSGAKGYLNYGRATDKALFDSYFWNDNASWTE